MEEIEQELSEYNHKTLDFDKYKDYLGKKIEIASKVASEYQDQLYRKLKWNTYMNRQRVEDQFMNKFKELWPPDKFIVGIGDYGPSHHMKHLEPVKGKGFRKMFRRKGYEIYLVDEYRTSIRCYNCGCGGQIGRCEKFRECENPNPKKRERRPRVIRHGLLMCQTCRTPWCRDTNSSFNILKIMSETASGRGRPEYLRRD